MQLHRRRTRLATAVGLTASTSDPEAQALLVRHLCILASGLLEQSTKDCAGEFARNSGHIQFLNFVDRRLRRGNNLNKETLLQLIADFDAQWSLSMALFLDTRRESAINSIYINRNSIAHGLDVNLGLVQMQQYLTALNEVIDEIFRLFGI